VLPDEASLATILAHELGHVVLGHRMDSQFAFLNRVRFDEKETFRHFGFARTPEEEAAANQKGIEILSKSPYKDQSGNARLFLQALKDRAKEIPNLISPHLGDRVPARWSILAAVFTPQPSDEKPAANASADNMPAGNAPAANQIAALPIGGRIKIEPWNDHLQLLKSKPAGTVAEAEKNAVRGHSVLPVSHAPWRPPTGRNCHRSSSEDRFRSKAGDKGGSKAIADLRKSPSASCARHDKHCRTFRN